MKTYKYVGSVASYRLSDQIDYNIELYNYESPNIPPIRLTASGEMFRYIDDLEGHDAEEKYMDKEFYYDMFFNLLAVVIPGNDRRPAKVVISDRVDDNNFVIPAGKVKFYGTDQLIDERHPDSMSIDEYDRLSKDVRQMDVFRLSRYEYPTDYWSTVRNQKNELIKMRKRIRELEAALAQITDIARNAE